jgi:hypothetical protein
MQDALKRLRALQQELESLHRTTAKVLAESEELIGQLERPTADIATPRAVAERRPRKPATARRVGKRAR